ncbi:MAG: AAA family ATPase [Clostridia bacterium]|nr:AAA family ATPase [Clostridia bacterium]
MKLISCHIDGFGAIRDKDYTFDKGLTGILGENGAGKSTLAAFLSAMFYGMETANKRSVQFLDREHFFPFGGGAFGGSLVFLSDGGDVFRVRRLFDEKTGTQDSVTVTKNDAPYDCKGREIGEILFGVDRDAFIRTVFLSADTLDPDPGKSISDRLCEAVSNPEGTVSADKAIDALEKAAKKIVPARGKNSNGELFFANRAATEIEDRLRAAQEAARALPDLRERYAKADADMKALNLRNLWASYDDLQKRADDAKKRLQESNARFANGVPDGAALSETERKIALREKTAHDAEVGFVPSARQAELAAKFAAKRPDDAALADMETKAQAIRDAQAVAIPVANPQKPSPEKPGTAGWLFPVAVMGGLSFLAGLIFLILSMTVPGAILLGVGVLDLGVAAFLLFQGKVKALERSITVVDPGGAERARRAQLDADLAALLAPYGYSSRDGALAAYADLKRDLAELAATEEQKADAAGRCRRERTVDGARRGDRGILREIRDRNRRRVPRRDERAARGDPRP